MKLLSLLSLLLFVLNQIHHIQACGMVTHNEIANRATIFFDDAKYSNYKEILLNHLDAVQGGAPFPDWGYACGFHDAGEAAHWEPFQIASINHIRTNYPQPWNNDTQKLVAFMLGVASHYVADLNWHGLGESYPRWATPLAHGFLKAFGGVNYGCNGTLCDTAHSAGDTGGEFMVDHQFDISWLLSEWYLPTKDVMAIYASLNYTNINQTTMEQCFVDFFLVSQLQKLAGRYLFPLFAYPSPFLVSDFQNHPVGGVDNNAVWTTWKWQFLINWLENGVNTSSSQVSTRSQDRLIHPLSNSASQESRDHFKRALFNDGLHAQAAIRRAHKLSSVLGHKPIVQRTSRGLRVRLQQEQPQQEQEQVAITPTTDNKKIALFTLHDEVAKAMSLSQTHSQSSLQDIADQLLFNMVAQNSAEERTQSWLQNTGWHAGTPLSPLMTWSDTNAGSQWEYFGRSLLVGDFNHDGADDLVIGAPGWGVPGQPQVGHVYIYYGNTTTHTLNAAPVILMSGDENGQFGWALARVDLNKDGIDDLAVGAPSANGRYYIDNYSWDSWQGRVYIFWGKSSTLTEADVVLVGDISQTNALMGRVLTSADLDQDGFADLLIGGEYSYGGNGHPDQAPPNPYPTGETFASRGAVACFFSSSFQQKLQKAETVNSLTSVNMNNADWLQRGPTDFEFFGAEIIVVPKQANFGPLLIVSSPQFNNATGRVYIYNFMNFETPNLSYVINGPCFHSTFGSSLSIGSPYNDSVLYLSISAPTLTPNNNVLSAHSGGVYLVSLPFILSLSSQMININDLQENNKIKCFLSSSLCFGRLSHSTAFQDINKDGVDDFLVSLPFLSLTLFDATEDGAMYFYQGGASFPSGSVTASSSTAQAFAVGDKKGGRFGEVKPVFIDINNDGVKEMITSAPRGFTSSHYNNAQTGVVYAFNLL